MIDTQVRTSYGSLNYSSSASVSAARPAERANDTPAPSPKVTQGPGFSTYVVAPTTLLAAQEARQSDALRRDDAPNHPSGNPDDDESTSADGLTAEEQKRVAQLKKTDQEVRAHERAHKAAGGSLTGPAHFTYEQGPDGQSYAVSGEVSIDTGREGSAAATVKKMKTIIRAATAPANPSAQDLAVAAQARQTLNEASSEVQQEQDPLDGGDERKPTEFNQATKAYRERAAQDDEMFMARQAHEAINLGSQQNVDIII